MLEETVAAVAASPDLDEVEILKSTIAREHGAYVIGLVIDREGGVDIALCESVSRALIRRVDQLVPPVENYRVEVSSAGLDRPLLSAAHYRRFRGQEAKVITRLRIGTRIEFTGAIGSVTDDAVTILDPHAGPTPIPYAVIKRAHLVYDPSQDFKKKR